MFDLLKLEKPITKKPVVYYNLDKVQDAYISEEEREAELCPQAN
jgi:hypothetical protein